MNPTAGSALASLLFLLSGCSQGSEAPVSVDNQSGHPVEVQIWMNGTHGAQGNKFVWAGTLAAGTAKQVGLVHLPFGPSYTFEALVDGTKVEQPLEVGDDTYSVTLKIDEQKPYFQATMA